MAGFSEEDIVKLASSLKENRLVASMDEAIEKAQQILNSDSQQESMTAGKFGFISGTKEQPLQSLMQMHDLPEEDDEIDLDIDPEDMPRGIIDPSEFFANKNETR